MKKRILSVLFVMIFCISSVVPVYAKEFIDEEIKATQTTTDKQQLSRLVDDANLLSDSEERELLYKLDEISERQQMDVIIVTKYSLNGKSSTAYADDFYDYNGYGMGESYDGILLLISMENRDWSISTCGYGITVFTDAGQEYMSDHFLSDLSDGDYFDAFSTFADLCDDFITQANTGEPYDYNNLPKEPFNLVLNLLIALVLGVVIALIVVTYMKSQLNSVKSQKTASNYVRSNSMQVTQHMDLFLYHVVTRRPKPRDNGVHGGHGGSHTHMSSSGRMHGGSHGHF